MTLIATIHLMNTASPVVFEADRVEVQRGTLTRSIDDRLVTILSINIQYSDAQSEAVFINPQHVLAIHVTPANLNEKLNTSASSSGTTVYTTSPTPSRPQDRK